MLIPILMKTDINDLAYKFLISVIESFDQVYYLKSILWICGQRSSNSKYIHSILDILVLL